MNTGKTLFAQIMDFLPWKTFLRLVSRYDGDSRVRTLPCSEHFRVLAFAQLTYRESLRDIEAGAFFVTRAKSNADLRRVYSAPSDRTQGIICDQTVTLSGFYSHKRCRLDFGILQKHFVRPIRVEKADILLACIGC